MALTRYKLGDLIEVVDERNAFNLSNFYGININKAFMPTAANTRNLDPSKYKVVRKNRFVFSGMQTGRDKNIRISLYQGDEPIIVSPAYTTFEITALNNVAPEYFFMLFLSKEMDRYGWFLSDTSIRSNLDWSVFCDIDIDLPPLEVQQKYVAIYNAMVANQQAYELGLENLRLLAEIQLDEIKRTAAYRPVGEVLVPLDRRNTDEALQEVTGINIVKQFIPSTARVSRTSKRQYKVIQPGEFGYSSMQTGRDETIRIALNESDSALLVSPAYDILRMKCSAVSAKYVMLWYSRSESDRQGWFASDASIRANLDLGRFFEMLIPIPYSELQKAIVAIYETYVTRREINERLRTKIKDICPVLIKGSLEEGARHDL